MGILDKKNLHLYPAFISLLCSRISESELLENSTNVNRLYLETVRALVHYLGAIKISLLRNDNSRESEEKLRVLISRLSPSTDSKWDSILEHGGRELMERLAFSTEDHGELRAKGILEIRKIISEFLYAEVDRNKSMAKLVADFRHEFHEPSLECATNLDLLAMLMAYADVVSKAKDRSMNRVERANEYLSKSLAYGTLSANG